MDTPADVLESWIRVDPSVASQTAHLLPGETYTFRWAGLDRRINQAVFTYEEVRVVLARMVLKGLLPS